MKKTKILCFIASLAIVLSACGGGGSNNSGNGSSSSAGNSSSSSSSSGAKAIFEKSCSQCHGENLQGKVGPNLQQIGSKMSKKQILGQIKNGGGGMPANVITGQKAKKVAAWLSKKK